MLFFRYICVNQQKENAREKNREHERGEQSQTKQASDQQPEEKEQPERGDKRLSTLKCCLVFIFHTLSSGFHLPLQLRYRIPFHHSCVCYLKCWQAYISNFCTAFRGRTWVIRPSESQVWIFILLLPRSQPEKTLSRTLFSCPLIVTQSPVLPIWCIIFSFSLYTFSNTPVSLQHLLH